MESQLKAFVDKFDPKNQAVIRAVRKALRKRLPTANEIVYDNYNSIAAARNGVGLSFYRGAMLPDPHKVLEDSGSQNRFIRLESAATLERPEVAELIAAAIAQAKPLAERGKGKLIIQSISAKQRARRLGRSHAPPKPRQAEDWVGG